MSNNAPGSRIIKDDLRGAPVAALLREHLAEMALHSPPECIHALDLAALRVPAIRFWTAWRGDELVGCAALKELAADHAEIKSMRARPALRGSGIGRALLQHLLDAAQRRGYRRLSLETGSGPAFEPAHGLYRAAGFVACGPFADYRDDPFSRFMTLELPVAAGAAQ